jgi:hypothetical protein
LGQGSLKTYTSNWKQWCSFCKWCGRSCYIDPGGGDDTVQFLRAYLAYCFANEANKLSTINVKLAAVNHYHKVKFGQELPLSHCWLLAAKKGVDRSQGDNRGNVKCERLPLEWDMLVAGKQTCEQYQYSQHTRHLGQVTWAGLALTFLLLTRSCELFADNSSKQVHKDFGLFRTDLTFFDSDSNQLSYRDRTKAASVAINFRGSKGDQQRRGATVTRSGTALAILLYLLQLDGEISDKAPLMAYNEYTTTQGVTTRKQRIVTCKMATASLQHMITATDTSKQAKQYTLHSGRIGGATALAASGLPDSAIKAAGRWKSNAFERYVRPSREESSRVPKALTSTSSDKH